MKKIIFDFDGVICDSTLECLYISYNSFMELTEQYHRKINDINLININFRKKFIQYRNLVRGASQFLQLIDFIFSGENEKEIDKFLSKEDVRSHAYKKIFYRNRLILANESFDQWLKLHTFQNEVIKYLLDTKKSNQQVLIATLKDKNSINLLLENKGIESKYLDILDKDDIDNKLDAILLFKKKYDLEKDDIIFIDDNINHLIQLHKENYKTILATWFSNNSRQIDIAKKNEISTCNSFDQLTEELNE